MKRPAAALPAIALALLLSVFPSCRRDFDAFLGGGSRQTDLEEFFSLVEKYAAPERAKERYVLNKQIIDFYGNADLPQKKILYLTYIVERFADDPFNGYYLAVVAQTYQKMGAPLFAKHYYEKVIAAYEDLFSGGEYVHKFCLQALAGLSERPEHKIVFYNELLKRFDGSIDSGAACFSLARAYEAVGEYDRAVEAYRAFLNAPPTVVSGFPNAVSRVKEKLSLYATQGSWIRSDLNELVGAIRKAIGDKDTAELNRCRAQGYFFTLSWEQKNDPSLNVFSEGSITDYIGSFLDHSNVTVDEKLDIDSSAQEAYLRTDNWSFRVHPTWYFYFRKVDFPADPEINGGWEWAGIYFGEKL